MSGWMMMDDDGWMGGWMMMDWWMDDDGWMGRWNGWMDKLFLASASLYSPIISAESNA